MRKTVSLLVALAALTVGGISSAQAPARPATPAPSASAGVSALELKRAMESGGACLADPATTELGQCPPGTVKVGAMDKPNVGVRMTNPTGDAPKSTAAGVPNLDVSSLRDSRQIRAKQRELALLTQAIQTLEDLLASPRGRSGEKRQTYLRNIAENWVEFESAAFQEKIAAEVKRDQLKTSDPNEAGKQAALAKKRKSEMEFAQTEAIRYYKMLIDEFPKYPLIDEVLYYLAYEWEQVPNFLEAQKAYQLLIDRVPNSRFATNAYFALGELEFTQAQTDGSRWAKAKSAYERVIQKGESPQYGPALFKLAYVQWNMGESSGSLATFRKVIDYATKNSSSPGASVLLSNSRRDIINVYAASGRSPSGAFEYFKDVSGDTGGATTKTFQMTDNLGQYLLDTGKNEPAISLYNDLIKRDTAGQNSCTYQSKITTATLAMKSSDKEVVKAEFGKQIKRYQDAKKRLTGEALQKCANSTAALVAETAIAWHIEAVGSSGRRGTGNPKTMDAAADAYEMVVGNFSAEQFKTFEFPRIVKEDWPTIFRIKFNMAELLYERKQWAKCGPAFDSVVAENPTAPEAPEAAWASVLCYKNLYNERMAKTQRQGKGTLGKTAEAKETDQFKAQPFSPEQQGMSTAFNRYVCAIKPQNDEGRKQLAEVKYARGRLYFDSRRWEEAALAFRDVALNHADDENGIYAANLYLESLNILVFYAKPERKSCIADITKDLPKFQELYCSDEKKIKDAAICNTFAKVQCDVQRVDAASKVEAANAGAPNALELYQQAGHQYIELWRKYGKAQIDAGKPAQCENLDAIVYNAAEAYKSGRLMMAAIRAREAMLNPAYKVLSESKLAEDALLKIGRNYQAIAMYDTAAAKFEEYSRLRKDGPGADGALADATLLRLRLGQESEAMQDAADFTKRYGTKNPAQASKVAFEVGSFYAEQDKWDQCIKALEGSMGTIDRGTPDIQVRAHATLGRCNERRGRLDVARREYEKVASLWGKDGAELVKRIDAGITNERDRTLAKRYTAEAVGEALFFKAEEEKKRLVDPIKFPIYGGSGSKEDVIKFVKTKVVDWLKKKRDAIEKAEAEYKRITKMGAYAPPRWVVAAGSRSGLMWGDFVTEFRASPIPREWKMADGRTPNEIGAAYFQSLDEQSEPVKVQRAKPALQRCLQESVEFQYFDEFSRACEKWLADNYKQEYKVVDELRGSPSRPGDGLAEVAAPLMTSGDVWRPATAAKADEKAELVGDKKDNKKPKGK